MPSGVPEEISRMNFSPFSDNLNEKIRSNSEKKDCEFTYSNCNSSLPASIFDRSRISLIRVRRLLPLDFIDSR